MKHYGTHSGMQNETNLVTQQGTYHQAHNRAHHDTKTTFKQCLEQALTRHKFKHCGATHEDDASSSDQSTTDDGEASEVSLSPHVRDFSAYPIQTRLQDGRPSIIVDPGSVGNLCGDKWAKEIALMAKSNGRNLVHHKRDYRLAE